jgi:hypothetical protein
VFEDRETHVRRPDVPAALAPDLPDQAAQVPGEWAVPGIERPAVPTPLPEAIAALQAAVAGLHGWQPAALDGAQALACARVLLTAEQAVMSARTRSLTDMETRRLHRLDDARSPSAWLRQEGHAVAAAQLTLARRLSGLPLLADEIAAGRLSVAVGQRVQVALARLRPHLDRPDGLIDGQPAEQALYGVIVHGVRALCCQARGGWRTDDPQLLALVQQLTGICESPGSELARLEAAFVVLATQLQAAQATAALPGALAELVDSLLPAQLEERNRRGEVERGLSLTRKHDGTGWRVEGDLDLETGERAFEVLSAELRRDPDNPTDTAQAEQLRGRGLDPYDPAHDLPEHTRPRSRRERMHDALSWALGRYLAAGLGGDHDKVPVQVSVVASADGLDGAPGSLPARGGSGTSLPTSLVRRWACGSALTRFVLDLGGRVLEASHTERTLKAHERRALQLQTGGCCQRAGCTRSGTDPGAVLHPHHADPWARTGTTRLADTALLCDSCHSDVHHGRVITLKDGRRLGPDGWVT